MQDLMSTWDDDYNFEKLFKELNEIEQINDRVERSIENKIQYRISKFGQNGDKILGIDIPVPHMSPRDLPRLPSLAPGLQQNFSYTDRPSKRKTKKVDKSMFITEAADGMSSVNQSIDTQ